MHTSENGYEPLAKRIKLRKYEKLPVWICESHEEVLHHIYRAVASKHLPFSGITLLHFDSHPDLSVPQQLRADDVFDKEKLLDQIAIADWILPAVYAGHVERVIWVKPPWADQMDEGMFHFKVGKHKETGYIRVTCPENYYLEELLFSPEKELENCRDLELYVCTLHPGNNSRPIGENYEHYSEEDNGRQVAVVEDGSNIAISKHYHENPDKNHGENSTSLTETKTFANRKVGSPRSVCSQVKLWPGANEQTGGGKDSTVKSPSSVHRDIYSTLSSCISHETPYILDVDLDFFSTQNPFTEIFTKQEFQCICDVYRFDEPVSSSHHDIQECIKKRKTQLDEIKETLNYSQMLNSSSTESEKQLHEASGKKLNTELVRLLEALKARKGNDLDFELLHSAGMSMDLPHHVNSPQGIEDLMDCFLAAVALLPRPALVTVARSTFDEYTPPSQVELIQAGLLAALDQRYGGEHLYVHKDYDANTTEACTSRM